MADFDAQTLAKLPREQLVSLVVNNLNLISAEQAEKMRDDEIVHMLRMNFDTDYQKQVSAVSKAKPPKTPAPKKSVNKKTAAKERVSSEEGVKPVKSKKVESTVEAKQEAEPVKKTSRRKHEVKAESDSKSGSVSEDKSEPVQMQIEVEPIPESKDETVSEKPAKKTSRKSKKNEDKSVKEQSATVAEESVNKQSAIASEESADVDENKTETKTEAKAESKTESKTKAKNKASSGRGRKPKKAETSPETEQETTSSTAENVVSPTSSEPEAKTEQTTEVIVSTDNSQNKKRRPERNKRNKTKNSDNSATADSSEANSENVVIEAHEAEGNNTGNLNSGNEAKRNPNNNSHKKSKRRTISFGPGVETKVEATSETAVSEGGNDVASNENTEPVQPAEPEIQLIPVAGVLSIGAEKNDYCGFLHANNYLPGESDSYVSGQFIRRMGLRKGDFITGLATPARGKGNPPLKQILTINGIDVSAEDFDFDVIRKRKKFENLTAIYPDEKLKLESEKDEYSTRIIDIICPIGKGQRGMVVSPPKAGKTVLLKKIANAITRNDPKCKLIVLLIDERPEEVTDMQRSIKGEVVYSTFDKKPENHVRVTELVLERAMRLVEMDEDVVILLDSMTRLARAYNLTITPTGRTLSGGLDPGSLYGPKRFFGAARNIENGGSLTIISTSLIETGSRMDEVIFEEFKGTGNMEVVLDRKLADRRVFPAIAVDKSGTRREDLLLSPEELDAVWKLRKRIADFDTVVATDLVIKLMERTPSNRVFVDTVIKKFDEVD